MATRSRTITDEGYYGWVASWEGITEADDGAAVHVPDGYTSWSVQAVGDFDAGGAITMEGSNDGGTTYGTLQDEGGTDIVLTTAQPRQIAVHTQLVRPRATAGAAVSMDVYLFASAES